MREPVRSRRGLASTEPPEIQERRQRASWHRSDQARRSTDARRAAAQTLTLMPRPAPTDPAPPHPDMLEEVRATVRAMIASWLLPEAQAPEAFLEYVAEAFTGIGTGEHDTYESREAVRAMVRREKADLPTPHRAEIAWMRVRELAENLVLAECAFRSHIDVGGVQHTFEPRGSMVLRRSEAGVPPWQLLHFHFSVPDAMQQPEGGTLKTALEGRNRALEAEVVARTAELEQSLDELRATQARLVHQQKMASLGALVAGVAHEIKNPLNFVNNFAQLSVELAAEVRDELEEARGQQVGEAIGALDPLLDDLEANAQKVLEHGRRADAVVRGMGRHVPAAAKRRSVDLNGLVEGHVVLALGADGDAPVVERDYDPEAGAVTVDPDELGRAVQALVQNALDAVAGGTSAGDPVTDPRVVVRTRRADGVIRVEVEDNGAGVPADLHDRVFEPFFTTRPTGSGRLGLGLSVAHEVARGHGGTIEVGQGDGATFTLTLPAAPPSLAATDPPPADP